MKTIDIPVQVPDWAKWVAQDKNGDWWCYERMPRISDMGPFEWSFSGGDCELLGTFEPNPNWRETLREVE